MEGNSQNEYGFEVEKYESILHEKLKVKFSYLDKKIRLVEAASKLNALDFFARSHKNKCLIGVIVKISYFKNRFDINWKSDFDIIKTKLAEINDTLENIIEEIDNIDCIKRDDQVTYCRSDTNYGREYIEKGLASEFGYGIHF